MKRKSFSPDNFVEPNVDDAMKKMHTNEYMDYLDHSENEEYPDDFEAVSLIQKNNSQLKYESYPVHDQKIFAEIEQGSFAHLNELTTLPDSIAEIISRKLNFLNLAGIIDLTLEAAHFLGNHKGRLFLCGVISFQPGVAQELGHHEGFLDLARLATISYEDACALSQQKGDLRLSELCLNFDADHAAESEKILRAFVHHEGEILFSPDLQSKFEIYKEESKFKKVI